MTTPRANEDATLRRMAIPTPHYQLHMFYPDIPFDRFIYTLQHGESHPRLPEPHPIFIAPPRAFPSRTRI
jgi:hypothetical protein